MNPSSTTELVCRRQGVGHIQEVSPLQRVCYFQEVCCLQGVRHSKGVCHKLSPTKGHQPGKFTPQMIFHRLINITLFIQLNLKRKETCVAFEIHIDQKWPTIFREPSLKNLRSNLRSTFIFHYKCVLHHFNLEEQI